MNVKLKQLIHGHRTVGSLESVEYDDAPMADELSIIHDEEQASLEEFESILNEMDSLTVSNEALSAIAMTLSHSPVASVEQLALTELSTNLALHNTDTNAFDVFPSLESLEVGAGVLSTEGLKETIESVGSAIGTRFTALAQTLGKMFGSIKSRVKANKRLLKDAKKALDTAGDEAKKENIKIGMFSKTLSTGDVVVKDTDTFKAALKQSAELINGLNKDFAGYSKSVIEAYQDAFYGRGETLKDYEKALDSAFENATKAYSKVPGLLKAHAVKDDRLYDGNATRSNSVIGGYAIFSNVVRRTELAKKNMGGNIFDATKVGYDLYRISFKCQKVSNSVKFEKEIAATKEVEAMTKQDINAVLDMALAINDAVEKYLEGPAKELEKLMKQRPSIRSLGMGTLNGEILKSGTIAPRLSLLAKLHFISYKQMAQPQSKIIMETARTVSKAISYIERHIKNYA